MRFHYQVLEEIPFKEGRNAKDLWMERYNSKNWKYRNPKKWESVIEREGRRDLKTWWKLRLVGRSELLQIWKLSWYSVIWIHCNFTFFLRTALAYSNVLRFFTLSSLSDDRLCRNGRYYQPSPTNLAFRYCDAGCPTSFETTLLQYSQSVSSEVTYLPIRVFDPPFPRPG